MHNSKRKHTSNHYDLDASIAKSSRASANNATSCIQAVQDLFYNQFIERNFNSDYFSHNLTTAILGDPEMHQPLLNTDASNAHVWYHFVMKTSNHLINYHSVQSPQIIRSFFDTLCTIQNTLEQNIQTENATITKHQYLIKHLMWLTYYYIVHKLFNSTIAPEDIALTNLDNTFSKKTSFNNFLYREEYFNLISTRIRIEQHEDIHPLLLARNLPTQKLYELTISFQCYKAFIDTDTLQIALYTKLLYIIYKISFSYFMSAQTNLLTTQFLSEIVSSRLTLTSAMFSNQYLAPQDTLCIHAIDTILSDAINEPIPQSALSSKLKDYSIDEKSSFQGLIYDAMARIASQNQDYYNACHYSEEAILLYQAHNIHFAPSYKLYKISSIFSFPEDAGTDLSLISITDNRINSINYPTSSADTFDPDIFYK